MSNDLKKIKDSDFQKKMSDKIKKIILLQKPNGVEEIEVSLNPISNFEYYVKLTFIVPRDSEYLKRPRNYQQQFYQNDVLFGWKLLLQKSVLDYLGVKLYINNYGISAM
jgi:hypothetical protein